MEAVPRLPMISFQLKVSPEPTAFGPKLKQYIRDFYNEDPESYSNEIHQLEKLRAMVVRPSIAVTDCTLLQKYYCQLHFLQSRFPMGADEAAAVTFTWTDAYGNMVCSSANIRFEIMSILYNIGAVHTQMGARIERTSAEGMKMACAHFQCAAWAFEHLHIHSNVLSLDLAPELTSFMHQLCLAQAQECILEKSMLDNRKPTIVAKVAKQIIDYYSQSLATLEPNNSEDNPIADTVGSKIYKNWKRYVKFKRAYHLAVTQLYQGLAAEEQQKMGERVAFYNASLTALNEARSMYASAKGTMGIAGEKEAIEEALTFTNDVIEGKRKAAKNENEFIYHEEVPEKDVLPTINGASLVKGIPFSVNDPEVSGPDIFARLVPMKVHEASSLYSEEKAKILRSVGTKIEEHDQHLDTYLASLKLQHLSLWDPDAQSSESELLPLPDELAERCAALNARPNAIEDLVDIMGKLSDTYRDVEAMLKEIDGLLNEEEQREKRYQEAMGKRPPTIVATDLTREAKKYEEAHAKASESNQALHRAMTLHVNNLQVLAQPLADLMAKIPSPNVNAAGQRSDNESDKTNARELKRILGKVDEMQRQRNELHAKLRDSIAQDDLTRLLVTATAETGSLESLFSEQLGKHQALVNLIDQNLAAQENILSALTDAYARTADTRKTVEEILKRRELTISSLITSYDAYEDLLAKSTKGLEFYRKLEVNVTKLLQRVKSTCRVQEEEREQIMARNDKGNSGVSTETPITPATNTERKPGSGMKLRDHLAARLKNNTPASYHQQNSYGNEKHASPIASVQPNSHAATKTYPIDPSCATDPSGIPINAVTPIAVELQPPNQPLYQQYYPNDYTNYYMTQQQAQYHSGQYSQYNNDDSNITNGGTQSFPKTGTTNTDSMYRQASRHSASGTEVSSNSTRYAGYNIPRNEQLSASPLPGQQPQYPAAGQTPYESQHAEYAQYSNEYNMVPDNRGYQIQVPMSVQQPVVSSSGFHSVPSNHQVAYNQGNLPGNTPIGINQSPSHTQTPSQQITPSSNPYRVEDLRQDSTQPQTQSNLNHPQGQPQAYDSGQNYPYQGLPQQPISRQMLQPSGSPVAQGYSNTVGNVSLQNSQFSPQISAANPPYSMPEQYVQNQQISGIPTSSISSPHPGNLYPSSIVNVTGQSSVSSNMYYAPATSQPTNTPQQYPVDYTSQNQQSYADTSVAQNIHNSQIPTSQPVPNYQNSYVNYPSDSGIHQYPIASSMSSQIGSSVNYSNGTEMIQSHTKSTSNPGFLPNYQYPLQAHSTGIIQYPNYSQPYENYGNSSQTTPGQMASSSTDSYRGHPGYAYDPALGTYSYSSGYQDSQTTTPSSMSNENSYVLPQDGHIAGQPAYIQPENNSRYTSASNGATTNLTPSSQYSNGSYQQPNQNYYTTGYNGQSQNQDSTPASNITDRSNDTTYQQVSSGGNPATSTSPPTEVMTKPIETKPEAPKSNLDLLAELDITINHAPLVPEVHSIEKISKEEPITNPKLPEINDKRKDSLESSHHLDDKLENLQIVWDTWYTDVQPKRDPLGDPITLQKFAMDIEKYEKFVDSLTVKTLSGSTSLDIKWSEITDIEEREMKKQTCYVAQAHASANRTTNLVPYDSTRVRLSTTDGSSDYINASHVNDLTQWTPAAFIVAQAPKPESYEAFWTMIWEQGAEVVACLATDAQLNEEIYWPINKDNLTIGKFTLSLKSSSNHTFYIQRVINIVKSDQRIERVVVHMQYLAWPSSGLPSSPGSLLTFATDILSEQALRHCSPKPIVVHCVNGGSLSGLFLLAAAAVCHVRAGNGAVDVPLVLSTLVKYRRCIIEKDSLLFAYRMVLYHAQDTLMKRGILSSTRSTFECFENMKGNKGRAIKKPQHCHPSDDFLHNLGVGIQHGIVRQPGEQSIGQTSSQSKITTVPQEKTDKVDPLSQLDPLWSIRR
ncbi:tyrosine-protein phosphatase non-receptor type 23 isoform X2 [Venturia canescens]|uniref:tyrosine-protein phosphatase non-receptor type 23 isoform X2 n=1 Tax=Venturia canescens TaxID=32260 RepID=UPI001C9D4429|nr:tyrosine-protein phosphatase non-receptor type 23 isoform X2 [Venturia canescens]